MSVSSDFRLQFKTERVFELLFGKASATRTAGFGGLPCESHKIRFPCPPAGLRAEPRLSGSNRNCRCSATISTQPLAELHEFVNKHPSSERFFSTVLAWTDYLQAVTAEGGASQFSTGCKAA